MIHASSNFSHQVAREKKPTHTLVTTGVYSFVRHPGYFGFFWWSVGTQIFLANPLAAVIFMAILWRFFSRRIQYDLLLHFGLLTYCRGEEISLVEWFGDEYVDYRKRVGAWIPFIS